MPISHTIAFVIEHEVEPFYRYLPVGQGAGIYTVDRKHARGGFRYLSLVNNGTGDVELTGLSVYYTAAPTQDLQKYAGYFHSNDELVNRVWYAGAYTNREYRSHRHNSFVSAIPWSTPL